ncbi:MAG: peptide chain release factor 2 [candidate division WOR-3 bacterium]|nr:peptide chain release factor 2 [candidate division WOR-3 bacterium]
MLDNKIREKLNDLEKNVEDLKSHVDTDVWEDEAAKLEKKMRDPNFWDNPKKAARISRRVKLLKDRIESFNSIIEDFESAVELSEMADESMQDEMEDMIDNITELSDELQTELLLTDEMDENDAIFNIHPGAGGTESCDWAEMLLRMYIRYFQNKGFKYTVMDREDGDVAGIKNVTINVSGEYAYGYLKAEIGVHRLVRVSPFDSNNRRHTSFASVYVYPDIDKNTDFEIDENELRIDTFRSSGPGGQSVNKISSAIRITHEPSGIVAQSQTERSQHQNKDNAMKILKAKVYEHYRRIEEEKLNKKLADKKSIEWGNQIRSYVLYPYKMVKDLRTKYETGDVDSVLDGKLDRFIKEYLMMKAKESGGSSD